MGEGDVSEGLPLIEGLEPPYDEHLAKALHWRSLLQYREAIEELRRSSELVRREGCVRFLLAELLANSGQWEEASSELHRAVEVNPENVSFRAALAATLSTSGRDTEALAVLREAEREFAADPPSLLVLAGAYDNLRYSDAAKELLSRLDVEGLPSAEALVIAADLSSISGLPLKALHFLLRAVEKDRSDTSAWIRLAEALLDNGDIESAQRAYGKALESRAFASATTTRTADRLSELGARLEG